MRERGSALYLSGGNRKNPYYLCRGLRCDDRAYAKAAELDSYVLNVIEAEADTVSPDAWVPRPGGDDAEFEEAEAALEEARADLDGFLSDTTLRRTLGADRYNEAAADYVAVVNKAEADMTAARERSSGSLVPWPASRRPARSRTKPDNPRARETRKPGRGGRGALGPIIDPRQTLAVSGPGHAVHPPGSAFSRRPRGGHPGP